MPIDYLNDAGAGDFNQQRSQRTQDLDRQLGYDMAGYARDTGTPKWQAEVQQRQAAYARDRGNLEAWLNRGIENGTLDQSYAGNKQRAYSDREKARQVASSQVGLNYDYLDPQWRPAGRMLPNGMGYSSLPDDTKATAPQPDYWAQQQRRNEDSQSASQEQAYRAKADRIQRLQGLNTVSGTYQPRSGPMRGVNVPYSYSAPLTDAMRAYA